MVRVLSTLALKGAVHSLAERYRSGRRRAYRCRFRTDIGAAGTAARRRGRRRRDPDPRGARRGRREGHGGRGELRRSRALLGRHRGEGRRGTSRYRDRGRAAHDVARRPFGGLFAARRQRHSVRKTDRALGIAADINARASIIPQGFTAERLVDRRGRSRGPADQRVEAGRGHRGGRTDSARAANALRCFPPAEWRRRTTLAASDRLLRFLASPEVAPALRESGLEP